MIIEKTIINSLLYLLTTYFVFKQNKIYGNKIGYCLYAWYAFVSIMGIIEIKFFSDFSSYQNINLFSYLILYLYLYILSFPVIKYKEGLIYSISAPNNIVLKTIITFIVAVIILKLFTLPSSINDIISMYVKNTFIDSYQLTQSKAIEDYSFSISSISSILFNLSSEFTIFLLFYLFTFPKKKSIIKIILAISILIIVMETASSGGRNTIMTSILSIIFAYLLFRKFYDVNTKKIVFVTLISLLLISTSVIIIITISRFENRTDTGVVPSLVNYAGQPMLNFNQHISNAKTIEYGDNTFPFARAILGLDYSNTPQIRQLKWEPKMGIPLHIFYTIVGDFIIDYGYITSMLIFIIFSIYVTQNTKVKNNSIQVHQLILIYINLMISLQGIFYFMYKTVSGNLKLLSLIGFYFIFKYIKIKTTYYTK